VIESQTPIYERVFAICEDYCFTDRWAFLKADEDLRRLPVETSLLQGQLSAEFTREALADAGVTVVNEDGSINLCPALTNGSGIVIALRDASRTIYDLLTEAGSLASREPPVLRVLGDRFTKLAASEFNERLLIAFSLEDVAVLRALRIPAVAATGLGDLPLDFVERLCDAGGIEYAASETESEPRPISGGAAPIRLQPRQRDDAIARQFKPEEVYPEDDQEANRQLEWKFGFVKWSVARFEASAPAEWQPVAEYFRKLDEYLGVEISQFDVWQLDEADRRRFEFFIEHDDPRRLREAIRESVDDALVAWDRCDHPEPSPAGETLAGDNPRNLIALFQLSCDGEGERFDVKVKKELRRKLQALIDERIFEPLAELAMQNPDLISRSLLLTAGQLSRMLHVKLALLGDRLSSAALSATTADANVITPNEMKEALALTDRILSISKEYHRCQPPSTINIIQAAHAPQRSLPSPNST
jgi:hypothetical protein